MGSPFEWYAQANARVRRVFWTCSAAWALDSMDALVYGFMIPALMTAFGMTLLEAQTINTANFVAAALGGWIGGLLCDRFGRARLLQFTILWFSLFSFLSGFATNYDQLMILRCLQGLGFGAEWAVGAVLLGEIIAPQHRGKAVGTVQSAAPIGTGMAALLTGPLLGWLGWQGVFWVGILPALLVFFVRRSDDDSEIYLETRKRLQAEKRTVYPWAIFSPKALRITLLTALLAIGIQGAAYSISNYLSVFLQTERGLTAKIAGYYILINSAGGFFGAQVNAYFSDRVGRRLMFRLFGAGFVIMASFYLLAPLGNSAWTLLPAGMVYGFFQFGLYASFGPYFTELFPTEIRGSGQSFAYNLGRAMSGLAFTLPVAWMVTHGVVKTNVGMLIGALSGIVLAIIATLMLPETAGRDLREAGAGAAEIIPTARQYLLLVCLLGAPLAASSATGSAAEERIERLSASVRNATAVRAVKRVQGALNHYREAGLWDEAAKLFTRDAVAQLGGQRYFGPKAIAAFLQAQALAGTGRDRLGDGDLNSHLAFSPVVTIDNDGRIARGRWHEISMTGRYNGEANWANGIYENEYLQEGGVWKIRRLHYHPSFVGPYTPGWRNADKSDKVTIVPFHYSPDGAGLPIPLRPVTSAADRAPAGDAARRQRVAELNAQLLCLQSESQVRSLQSAYGFYMDRRMWDDIADLYAADGTFEPGQRGVYRGRASIRHALEQIGPINLAVGVINDHIQMQPVVTLAADCKSATLRGTEFVMAGQNGGDAAWGLNIHDDTYRFIDGKWRLQSAHVYQRMRSDYTQGWAKSAFPVRSAQPGFEPDAPPTVQYAAYPVFYVPSLKFRNPGLDKNPFGKPAATPAGSLDALLADAERNLDIVMAQDGVENVSNAYGYYIDESQWDLCADLFAVNGSKELAGVGNYIGREHVRESMVGRYGRGGRRAAGMTLHQKTQPVVTVAADGQTARVRNKLLQLNSSRDGDGSYIIGIYENNFVREQGAWKISRMDLDYTWNANYSTGWARVTPRRAAPANAPAPAVAGAAPASTAAAAPRAGGGLPPPDGPLRGAPAAPYPDLFVMAFHYKNPVSGRDPPELLPP